MNKNKNFFILVAIVVIIILFILAWLLFGRGQNQDLLNSNSVGQGNQNTLPLTNSNNNTNTQARPSPAVQQTLNTQAEVKRFAAAFAERFGSYSDESNFENLTDSKSMMTEKMSAWTDLYIRELNSQPQQAVSYYGITTKALSVNLKNFNENSNQAIAEVACQRIESKETTTNQTVSYQTLVLEIEKSGSGWLINGATWQK